LGGVPISDAEDATAATMDNVTSCGAQDLFRIDAVKALNFLDDELRSGLQELQLELFKADQPEERAELLEASGMRKAQQGSE
jgi:hypothetical protein